MSYNGYDSLRQKQMPTDTSCLLRCVSIRRDMMRMTGMRRWFYLLTCDKPCIDKKALQIRRSLEEVKKLLNPQCCGK